MGAYDVGQSSSSRSATANTTGFFQDGKPVWENYANEHVLPGTTYTIAPGSAAHEAIKPGALPISITPEVVSWLPSVAPNG